MRSSITEIIVCELCKQRLRVPKAVGEIRVKCSRCGYRFLCDTGKKLQYQIVDVEQGTSCWHKWRDGGLGASDAPAIMGENPWKSRDMLMSEKLGAVRPFPNQAMKRGSALEPEARMCYERVKGITFRPLCVESVERPWMRASLDGLSINGQCVVEIKCGTSVYKYTAKNQKPPRYYIGQLQHILAITGLTEVDFWCYLPEERPVHLIVPRNDQYIRDLLIKEELFWNDFSRERNR
ncbi:MAG: YqaJ viral recombinase family protein [Spirochaetota bacterium]|jgi:putative phage-type endonuclease